VTHRPALFFFFRVGTLGRTPALQAGPGINPKPKQFNPKPKQFHPKPKQFDPKPKQFDPKPKQFHPKPKQFDPKPKQFNPKPKQFNPKPKQFLSNTRLNSNRQSSALHDVEKRFKFLAYNFITIRKQTVGGPLF
jgi:hypothetical protein